MTMALGELRDREPALVASRAEAGVPPQESGIRDTEQIHFGPATHGQYGYELGQWNMLPLER
jgi:hypothetical protein